MKTSTVLAMVCAMVASAHALVTPTFVIPPNGTTLHPPSASRIPPCAIPCIEGAIANKTSCAVDDYACACKSYGKIYHAATNCVIRDCGFQEAISMYSASFISS